MFPVQAPSLRGNISYKFPGPFKHPVKTSTNLTLRKRKIPMDFNSGRDFGRNFVIFMKDLLA